MHAIFPLSQSMQQGHLREALARNLLCGDLELVCSENDLTFSSQNFFVEDLGSIGNVWRLSDLSDQVIAVSSVWGP